MGRIRDAIHSNAEWIRAPFSKVQRLKRAYQLSLGSPIGQQVLADLARYCHANDTTFDTDARLHAFYEGQKDVWLHIQRYLHMTPEQLLVFMNPHKDRDNVSQE